MEAIPRDYGERCRFDAFCKAVLKHEAIDYIREMKRRASRETSLEHLPLAVSDAARAGDADAVERVLRYYEGYINKLCTRTFYDETGCPHTGLDEYMKRRLETKLIQAIVDMDR